MRLKRFRITPLCLKPDRLRTIGKAEPITRTPRTYPELEDGEYFKSAIRTDKTIDICRK
jgi:hypothetical protein